MVAALVLTVGSAWAVVETFDIGVANGESTVDAAVAEASAFVAEVRQLEFLEPVEVELLDDEAFLARLNDGDDPRSSAEAAREEEITQAWWEALHLIDPAVDINAAASDANDAGVVGFYDSRTGDLVVRGTTINTYVMVTLVHELTHALDDQHFELDPPSLDDASDDAYLAHQALTEGDAVRVEDLYFETLSDAQIDDFFDEQDRRWSGSGESTVPVLDEFLSFPYVYGPEFVRSLADAGGERAIDAAFEAPPVSTEQILDPDAYFIGEEPQPVDAPPADEAVADDGPLGAYLLYLMVAQVDDRAGVDASFGWGGDSSVLWEDEDGGRWCARADLVADTSGDLAELTDGLLTWAEEYSDVAVETMGEVVRFTSCVQSSEPV